MCVCRSILGIVKVHIFDWSEVYFRDQPHLAAGSHGSHLNRRNSNALVGFMCCCHFWDQTVSIDPQDISRSSTLEIVRFNM